MLIKLSNIRLSRASHSYSYFLNFARNILCSLSNSDPMAVVIESVTLQTLLHRLDTAESLVTTLSRELKGLRDQITLIQRENCFDFTEDIRPLSSTANQKRRSIDACDNVDKKLKLNPEFIKGDNEGNHVVVYTDGACEKNGTQIAKAGIGVWFGRDHPLNISKPVVGRHTNNTAEIQACTAALKVAHENGIDNLIIRTDSQFTINCITKWILKWKKNGWKLANGGAVKNKEDLIDLDNAIKSLQSVKWEYVAGHRGNLGNEEADKLARQGALLYMKDTLNC